MLCREGVLGNVLREGGALVLRSAFLGCLQVHKADHALHFCVSDGLLPAPTGPLSDVERGLILECRPCLTSCPP